MYLLRMVYAMNEVIRPQTFTITECHKTFYQRYIYSVFDDMSQNINSTIQFFWVWRWLIKHLQNISFDKHRINCMTVYFFKIIKTSFIIFTHGVYMYSICELEVYWLFETPLRWKTERLGEKNQNMASMKWIRVQKMPQNDNKNIACFRFSISTIFWIWKIFYLVVVGISL